MYRLPLTLPPLFHEALSGQFYLPNNPNVATSLADMALVAMENGTLTDIEDRITFSYKPLETEQIKIFVATTRGELPSKITLKDVRNVANSDRPYQILNVNYVPLEDADFVQVQRIQHRPNEAGNLTREPSILNLPCTIASAIIAQHTVELIEIVTGKKALRTA